MTFFRDYCGNGCLSQASYDGFGSGRSFSSYRDLCQDVPLAGFGSGRSFGSYRDLYQDVPLAGFSNIGSFRNISGSLPGVVYVNSNEDVEGRFSGRFNRLPELLGRVGYSGIFGHSGLSFPFCSEFGNRTV